ncbi:hypothetical protein BH20ACI2_BH20ACI2_10420 [soil metagenome]
MIVTYNFLIGVLVMLSSEKVASHAGYLNRSYQEKIVRVTFVSAFTFGTCLAVISELIYVVFHLLRVAV